MQAQNTQASSSQTTRNVRSLLTFNKKYFGLAVALFIVEVLIALYVKDKIIRPYIGDMLVVIFLYCLIKAFIKLPVMPVALFVLIFSFTIEMLQYLNIVTRLGLQHSTIARVVIGTLFEWIDLVAYVAGIAIVLMTEKYNSKSFQR